MPVLAAIELAFDPYLQLGDLAVRWQTVGVTAAILLGLAFAAAVDGRVSAGPEASADDDRYDGEDAEAGGADGTADASAVRLRLDDLGYIVVGAVPGAALGGRLFHGLAFWDAYAADPLRLLDPAVGSLSLLGAVVGGALTAAYVARVVGAPVVRWADASALPLLLTVAGGKLGQLLGGSGQGAPWDGPWAVAFVGAGPWISPVAEVPAHPSQVYEALWLLAGLMSALAVGTTARFRLPRELSVGGLLFLAALGWMALGRVIIGFTWRDEVLFGPLNAEQAIALVVLAGVLAAAGLLVLRGSIVRADSDTTPGERRT